MQTVRPIEKQEIWNQFLNVQQPNTFLHSWNWGEFQKQMNHKIWRLGIYEQGTLLGVALIIKVQAKRGAFLFCPHGPIFIFHNAPRPPLTLRGGDQAVPPLKVRGGEEGLRVLTEYLKVLARAENCGFIRFSPLMLNTPENNQLWHDLGFRGAPTHMHPELAWILDISKSKDEILSGMRKQTRYSIKKAEKDGVKITISNDPADLEKFWAIYKKTVTRQNFTPFSKNYLQAEFEIFNKDDQVRFFFGEYKGALISAAMIVFQDHSAFYHQGASDHQYPAITASHLMQWRIIQEAKKRGCKFYNFWGVIPAELTKHPWVGLSLFKRGFGGFSEAYVHAQDLRLKPSYWITYIIETIRRMKRGL